MKTTASLALIMVLSLAGYIPPSAVSTPQAPVVITTQEKVTPLENARRATFLIMFPGHNYSSGTAVMIARKKLASGLYRYRALTAYHVIRRVSKALTKDVVNVNRSLTLMFQPRFHGAPLRLQLKLDDVEWAIPSHDWAAFTFDMKHKMECVKLATRKEFEAIGFEDRIYLVGAADRDTPHIRIGNMGATHNQNLNIVAQNRQSHPWNRHPNSFFRPAINVWYGDSGGGIFNKDGKLIGLIIAFGMVNDYNEPVTHSTLSLKSHVILEMTKDSKGFFLVED
jgi:hypothetical protein